MSDYWKTKSFKKLQQTWSKKLAKSGFVDAENASDSDAFLNRWDDQYFRRRFTVDTAAARQEYFYIAFQFLHSYKFKTARDKAIWAAHADGLSFDKIGEKLKLSRDIAFATVKRLKKVCFGDKDKNSSGK